MADGSNRAKWFAVALALVFLAAQFHLCADLSVGADSSHFCPFCSTAAAAIAADVPILGIAPVATDLEIAPIRLEIATTVAPSISPRAPPSFVVL